MGVPPSPVPPLGSQIDMQNLIRATQAQATATLTAAIVAASGKPHSIAQVMEIFADMNFAQFPAPGNGAYDAWLRGKDAKLNKVHGA